MRKRHTVRDTAVVTVSSTTNQARRVHGKRRASPKKKPALTHIKLDPMVLTEVKRIIRPSQRYIILSETEALLVPR